VRILHGEAAFGRGTSVLALIKSAATVPRLGEWCCWPFCAVDSLLGNCRSGAINIDLDLYFKLSYIGISSLSNMLTL
jgi:hypothetical protein